MPDITIRDFSAGWTPGDDPVNGRKNGLLQMNNLELDSNGALMLAGGTIVKQSGYAANAHTLYSRLINGARADYAAVTSGVVYRNNTSVATGGDSTNAAFGTAFNFTLICSGNTRKKDDGTTLVDLGIATPGTPVVGAGLVFCITSTIPLTSSYVTVTGTIATVGGLQMTSDATTGLAIMQSNGVGGIPFDFTSLIGAAGTGTQTDNDYFNLLLANFDIVRDGFQIDILLVAPGGGGAVVSDYYSYNTGGGGGIFTDLSNRALGSFSGILKLRRSDFTRVGSTSILNWSTVYGIRVSFSTVRGVNTLVVTNNDGVTTPVVAFRGGSLAPFGVYDYAYMWVNNTGSYLAKSTLGPAQIGVNVEDLSIPTFNFGAPSDSQVNEVWVFRRNNPALNVDGTLDQWYRVKVVKSPWGSQYDNLGDADALVLDVTVNLNLVSIASGTITDKIYDIVGPINGRWYYFTTNFMYPSDINDPDLVDVSIAIRIAGSSSDLFLWARQISDTVVLVGTSFDVHVLTGTFATLPDNTIDIYYRGLQTKYPPLTCDASVWGGAVYYLANDGWRVIDSGGGNPSLISPTLDRLYRGETIPDYESPNLKVIPRSVRFPIVLAKNKMYCFITGIGIPRIEVYDFIRQYWRPVTYGLGDVTAATFTQDGQVIAFYLTDKKLREIDVQSSRLIDGATKQGVAYKSMVFDNNAPFNRKDSATYKMRLMNGDNLHPFITPDSNGVPTGLTNISAQATLNEAYQDISQVSAIALVKTYQVSFSTTTSVLVVDEITISFDQRPEQRTFIRIQSQNYGTTARKRIASIPFQLDSLGGLVIIDSYLDGSVLLSASYSANRKTSFNHEFTVAGFSLPIAKDFEYVIRSSTLFEFFGFEEPRILEIYAQQCKGYNLPVTNYGSASRKRVRVLPFVLSAPVAGTSVVFTPLVDGAPTVATTFTLTSEKATYRHYFKTDVFGVDYAGYFTSSGEFEVDEILQPEIVQTLPIAKRFDQVGPEEFFRYGKIKMIELRVLPIGGSSIPYTIYFNDNTSHVGSFSVVPNKEGAYFLMLPKGTSGNIVRIEIGPTDFDFHRFYTRLQVTASGNDTDLKWINL